MRRNGKKMGMRTERTEVMSQGSNQVKDENKFLLTANHELEAFKYLDQYLANPSPKTSAMALTFYQRRMKVG